MSYLLQPGLGCLELRLFNATIRGGLIVPEDVYKSTLHGYFDSPDAVVSMARSLRGVSAYVTFNPVSPDLLGRARNRIIRAKEGQATSDEDVERLSHLFIDLDPHSKARKAGISSTDAERGASLARRETILAENPELAASSHWGCSGNGDWILARLPDYPNDAAHIGMVARFLKALGARYSDAAVEVDQVAKNASRVMCQPGTRKCKGDDLPERPHRMATIDSPERELVPLDLEAWAAAFPDPTRPQSAPDAKASRKRAASTGGASPRGKYVQEAFDAEIGLVRSAGEGHRNDQLNRSAFALGQFVGAGELAQGDVERELADAGRLVGLGDREIDNTIRSGLSKGIAQPRDMSGVGTRGGGRANPERTADDAPDVLVFPKSPESIRADAAIKEGGVAGLLRDKGLLAALAAMEDHNRGEFGAILSDLKKVRGFPVKEFRAALKGLRPKPARRNPAESCYTIRGGGYWFEADAGEGPVKLSNFVARITEEVTVDDGLEPVMRFKIAGTLWDGRQVEADMPAAEFPKMAWVSARFGSEAIPEAGRGIMDQLRAAIQHHSTKVERRVTYTTTGWRLFGGDWKYLHAGGAIGVAGHDSSILTQLKGSLGNYRLPPPPPEAELRDCVRAALGLSRLHQAARPFSKAIAAVSLAAPWRAAIGACNFAIQAAGVTGSFKTTWAALLQQHFGAGMNARGGLPLSWGSTANLIETQMYAAAHAIQVIDDFVPGGNERDLSDIHKLAERVFRAQGNNLGRQRLNPDGTPKPDMPPRGLPVSTGEDRVRRRSADARTLPLRFSKDDPAKDVLGSLDPTSLARCQADADAGLYAGAMAGFLQHIAGRYEETRAAMEERAKSLRPEVTRPGDHGRTPDIVADLVAGFEVFLSFADAIGAIAPAEVKAYRDLALEGLMEAAGEAKADRPGEVEPGDLFIQLIVAALSGGRVFLGDIDNGDAPEGMEAACGWRLEVRREGSYEVKVWDTGPNAEQIGWTDGSLVYLEPKLSYQVARRLADTQGEAFPVAAATLHRLLDESKRLAMKDTRNESGEGRGRLTCRKQLQKKQRSVLVLSCNDLWPPDDGSTEGKPTPEAETSAPPEDVAYWGPAR